MSLLIKALQKAEEGKKQETPQVPAAGGTPPQELMLELVDDRPGLSSEQQQGSEAYASQQAAATIFAAKEAGKPGVAARTRWVIGALLFALMLAGAGFYYYLNSLQQPELVLPKTAMPPAPVPIAESAADSQPPSVPQAESASDELSEAHAEVGTSAAEEKDPASKNKTFVAEAVPSGEAASSVTPVASVSKRKTRGAAREGRSESSAPLSVRRNVATTGINPDLMEAYQAYNSGDDTTAQRLYRQVLQADVRNVDALLGMAAIAMRQGRNNDVAGWYGKVLEIEPKNMVAQAALLSMTSQADPVSSESRLKTMLASQPESAYLHSALGDLYATQNQWGAAQQAYFQAYHLDASNTQYAYNLAVSLDQMGKTSLALQYYLRALELLPSSNVVGIDRDQLESRITQLRQ